MIGGTLHPVRQPVERNRDRIVEAAAGESAPRTCFSRARVRLQAGREVETASRSNGTTDISVVNAARGERAVAVRTRGRGGAVPCTRRASCPRPAVSSTVVSSTELMSMTSRLAGTNQIGHLQTGGRSNLIVTGASNWSRTTRTPMVFFSPAYTDTFGRHGHRESCRRQHHLRRGSRLWAARR